MGNSRLFLVTLILISSLIILQIDYSWAAFPGDNGKIAFEKDDDIFVMNSDGSDVTNLTNDGLFNNNPNWSSDGTKIVFDRGEFGSTDIFIINADGSGLTRITDHPGSELMPAWSPDGDKIAFISTRDGNAELYVMNEDGSDQTRLTNNLAADELPNWSPLGDRIVIHSGSQIITINPDGTNPTNLSPAFSDRDPNWSPDANKIVFHSFDGNDFEVFSMDADGSNRMVLTNFDSFDGMAAWSPDGNKIVFCCAVSGITIMNSDGSDLQFLTDGRKPDWQPIPQQMDPVQINFNANLDGSQEVPPVSTTGTGIALFELNEAGTEISFRIEITNLDLGGQTVPTTDDVTGAHIHLAPVGVNGGIVVGFINPSTTFNTIDAVAGKIVGTIVPSSLTGSLAGKPLSDLVNEMISGNTYVNIHTIANPGGEIRGQIEPCLPPSSGNWVVDSDCTLVNDAVAPANVIIQSGVILTIPNGLSLTLLSSNSLTVESGGRVSVVFGGNILFT